MAGTHETRRLGLDRDAVLDGAERRRERDIETADPGRYSRAREGCNPERAAEPNRDRRNWAECPMPASSRACKLPSTEPLVMLYWAVIHLQHKY
jgi:hypothetical protein